MKAKNESNTQQAPIDFEDFDMEVSSKGDYYPVDQFAGFDPTRLDSSDYIAEAYDW